MNDLEQRILRHLKARQWDDLRPADMAKSIMIEGAELLEIFQWDNKTLEDVRGDARKMEEIKKELADVLIYCLEMAVLLGIDSEAIVRKKLHAVARKYPAATVRRWKKEKDVTAYLRVKNAHRAERARERDAALAVSRDKKRS